MHQCVQPLLVLDKLQDEKDIQKITRKIEKLTKEVIEIAVVMRNSSLEVKRILTPIEKYIQLSEKISAEASQNYQKKVNGYLDKQLKQRRTLILHLIG